MTASSQRGPLYQPAFGRLDPTSGNGWCTKQSDRNDDWLQIDLGKTFEVCGVGSQGIRNTKTGEWVKVFKVWYSSDGSRWAPYKGESDEEFVSLTVIYSKTYERVA